MSSNINQLLNEFLYSIVSKQDKKDCDRKLFSSLSFLIDKNFSSEFLLNTIKPTNKINFNYVWDDESSFKEYFKHRNSLDYFGGNLSKTKYGLEKSQLKTLTSLLECIESDKNMISVNGAPGTGKSTLLNYVISNILIRDLFKQYNESRTSNFVNFLRNYYKSPSIFLTGQTKNSVKNVSDICKIEFPEEHQWIYSSNKELTLKLNDIFNSLDIQVPPTIIETEEDIKNQDDTEEFEPDLDLIDSEVTETNNKPKNINKKHEEIVKRYVLFNVNKEELCINFGKKCNQYYKENINDWLDFPNYLLKKINENARVIQEVNAIIKTSFSDSYQKEIEFYVALFNFRFKINNVYETIISFKENKKERLVISEKLIIEFNELIDYIKAKSKTNFTNFKKSQKFLDKYEKLTNKPNKIYKLVKNGWLEIKKHYESTVSFENVKNYFDKLNKSIDKIKNLFDQSELEELGFGKNIDLSKNIDDETMFNVILALDIVKINFNNIQQRLDIKYRTENFFIYRHICEWLYLDKLWNNSTNDLKTLNPLKPIISSNLQGFYFSKIWNFKKNNSAPFDYIVLDEASQVSWKYIPFLLWNFKKIIVVGDEQQLPAINDNNHILNSFKAFNYYDSNEIKDLLNKMKLFDFKNNKPYFESVLEWINHMSNIESKLSDKETGKKPGLYLLEHMRCPLYMYKIFNKCFYDETLEYCKPIEYDTCSFSESKNLLCSDVTYWQLTYNYEKQAINNVNLKEIKIAINFIFDNLITFIKHKNKEQEIIDEASVNYLIKNVYFISLYRNQNIYFKMTISLIAKFLSDETLMRNAEFKKLEEWEKIAFDAAVKIKKTYQNQRIDLIVRWIDNFNFGTVDATQGIGADFIIFSNVSENVNHVDKDHLVEFENKSNRLNVLWSRCKQHYIQIVSNKYMDSINQINTKTLSVDAQKGLLGRNFAEVFISEEFNRIEFNVDDPRLNNNLSIKNLWSINEFKEDIKEIEDKIYHIGKYGETIFDTLINNRVYSSLLSKKIEKELGNKIYFYKNGIWENKDKESSKEYDFLIDNEYFIDIKSSIKNGRNVFLSKREEEFAIKNIDKYIIGKLNDISKFNLNKKDQSSIFFILNKISFYKFNDDKKLTNNKKSTITYKLR